MHVCIYVYVRIINVYTCGSQIRNVAGRLRNVAVYARHGRGLWGVITLYMYMYMYYGDEDLCG